MKGALLSKKEQQLLELLEAEAQGQASDVEIVTVEVIGSSRAPVIRVYIDAEGGISFKELTESQEWIGKLMDEVDPFPGAYTLEVSSPGIDRPLRTKAHFARFAGDDAKIRTKSPMNGQSNFKGRIVSADDDGVTLDIDGNQVSIPFESMRRANLVGKVDF